MGPVGSQSSEFVKQGWRGWRARKGKSSFILNIQRIPLTEHEKVKNCFCTMQSWKVARFKPNTSCGSNLHLLVLLPM